MFTSAMLLLLVASPARHRVGVVGALQLALPAITRRRCPSSSSSSSSRLYSSSGGGGGGGSGSSSKGKLLVLGGTGYLGQNVCQRAALDGYSVVSLSRRGLPPVDSSSGNSPDSAATMGSSKIEYRQGDARQKESISNILQEGGFTGIVHCIGLLFDDASGLGSYNRFVSGSGSLPDENSTYDTITRQTAFNAIDGAMDYAQANNLKDPLPFCFTSAAEAGWPEVTGGDFIENLMPDFIKRYMSAKRAVEAKLMSSEPILRPIIVRPSLIYSLDRPASLPSVGAFTLFNKIGLPFVDRPVTANALAITIVRSMSKPDIKGKLRYMQIDELSR